VSPRRPFWTCLLRLMHKPCLLVFISDPNLESFLTRLAEDKGCDCYFARPGEQLLQLAKSIAPFMLLVDVTEIENEWLLKYVSEIKYAKPDFLIVALAGPTESLHHRLESAGCKRIFTKKNFEEKFGQTIEEALRMEI
jgi:CheY-like chemotaxis protein